MMNVVYVVDLDPLLVVDVMIYPMIIVIAMEIHLINAVFAEVIILLILVIVIVKVSQMERQKKMSVVSAMAIIQIWIVMVIVLAVQK
jgi:glycerol uptake facilitator-like aquaporin